MDCKSIGDAGTSERVLQEELPVEEHGQEPFGRREGRCTDGGLGWTGWLGLGWGFGSSKEMVAWLVLWRGLDIR